MYIKKQISSFNDDSASLTKHDGGLTNSLWRNQVTEEWRENNKDYGICNPGKVLEGHIASKLPMNPFVGLYAETERKRGFFKHMDVESAARISKFDGWKPCKLLALA